MNIIFDEEIDVAEKLVRQMTEAAEICVGEEGLDPHFCEVSFSFVDEEEIRRLNAAYRDKDAVTDVLSFPQYDDLRELDNEEEICLGDVVICSRVARRQAEEYGHSYERELLYLFVHSILHLLGYDHMEEEEKRQMRIREEYVMEKIGLTR
ncbi:MAG: rRNA maturation RNase YbeY [Anaerovoracaceae bacterium]